MRRRLGELGFAVGIGLAGALFAVTSFGSAFEESVGLAWLFRLRGPVNPPREVAVVAIDERSAIDLGLPRDPRTWPRSLHGRLLDALVERNVDVVAFDLAFTRRQAPAEDEAFAAAIARAGRVLLLETIERQRKVVDVGGSGAGDVVVETIWQPVPVLAEAAQGVAPLLLPNVPVRVSRFWAFLGQSEDRASLPVLALQAQALRRDAAWRSLFARSAGERLRLTDGATAEAAGPIPVGRWIDEGARLLRRQVKAAGGPGERLSSVRGNGALPEELGPTERLVRRALLALYAGPDAYYLNFYGPPGTIRHIPYAQLLQSHAALADDLDLAGTVVFIGYSELAKPSDFTRDVYPTVFGGGDGVYLSGAEIAATAYANLLTGTTLRPPSAATTFLLVLLLGTLFGLAAARPSPPMALPMTLTLALVYAALAQLLFSGWALWPPVAIPILAQMPLALIAGSGGQLLRARRREQELRRATEVADAASVAKTEALRMVGHDIRSPVQAIIGNLEQMQFILPDGDARRRLERALAAADVLLDLLNGILDVAAIEEGKLRIVEERVEIAPLLHSVIDLLQVQATRKELLLSLQIETGVPAAVLADPQRLRQILANLLTNAIKFTDQGEVSLRLAVAPCVGAGGRGEGGGRLPLVFSVTDTGIGIAEDAVALLFEPFRRVGQSVRRPGTGLGLSISRRLARMMGGDITVSSRPGQGSIFDLHLPAVPASAGEPFGAPPETTAGGVLFGPAEAAPPPARHDTT